QLRDQRRLDESLGRVVSRDGRHGLAGKPRAVLEAPLEQERLNQSGLQPGGLRAEGASDGAGFLTVAAFDGDGEGLRLRVVQRLQRLVDGPSPVVAVRVAVRAVLRVRSVVGVAA